MRFCKNCGGLTRGQQFCSICMMGALLAPKNNALSLKKNSNKKKN
jgi:hypothetical protein